MADRIGFIITSTDGAITEEVAQGFRNQWHRRQLPDGKFVPLTPTTALEVLYNHVILKGRYTITAKEDY